MYLQNVKFSTNISPMESWSPDVTAVPPASVTQCNLSLRVSFDGHSDNVKRVSGVIHILR